MNNKLSLALNVVLLIAVGVLFYLHFSSNKPATAETKPGNDSIPQLDMKLPASLASKKFLYVNADTLAKYYEPLAAKAKDVESKMAYYENDLMTKQQKFEENYMQMQQLYQQGKITEANMPEVEKDLRKLQTDVEMSQRQYDAYKERILKEQKQMYDEVNVYFKEYSKQHGIDFIFNTTSGALAYANDSLDISKEMARALNENYKKTQPAAPAPKKK